MSRKLIVALLAASFMFVGMSFAAVENIKVSGDMNLENINRDFSLGAGSNEDSHQFLISQIRLRFDADLTEGVSAAVRLISERTWGEDNSVTSDSSDAIELDLGYIELKEFLYQPLTLIVGRQNLRYGSGLIVGDPDTNQGINTADNDSGLPTIATDLSLRKSFDAARAILDFAPWTLDFVFAQVDENATNDKHLDEVLAGMNAAYDWSSYNGLTELYFFAANNTPRSTKENNDKDHVYVVGARTQFDPTDKITLGAEGAYQFGDRRVSSSDNDHIRAWAGKANAEYRFLNKYNVKIGTDYTYLQGDSTTRGERHSGWNPMWEDETPAEIINVLMENSNAHYIRITGSMMPREDVTLGMVYCHAMLDKTLNSTSYSPLTNLGVSSGYNYTVKTDEKQFGDEVDLYGVYDYTEDVQIKLVGAFFIPGDVFAKDNDNTAYSVRAGLSVDF